MTSKLIDVQFLSSGLGGLDKVGTAKKFPVGEIVEVVLKFKKINYLIYTTTYEFTSLFKFISF